MIRDTSYADCVGYAFEQCYSSSIEVIDYIRSDEEHLQQLKDLVAEYEMACEIVEDESTLLQPISASTIAKIKAATTLDEAYR